MSKSTKWILISLAALVVLTGILKVAGVFGKDEGTKVTAEKSMRRNITEIVSASGKIYPEIEVKVSPDISGEVTELTVQEGDSVKKGQIVARIYADIYSIQRNQAASGVSQSEAQVNASKAAADNARAGLVAVKANMEQAQRTYNMQKKLYDEKVISLNEFNIADAALKTATANYNAAYQSIKGNEANIQSARATVQSAQASLQKANKDLGRTAVVAPMDGVVSLLSIKKGERVVGSNMMAGTEMLRIADMNKIEIRVDVGESDITKVHLGDSAVVTVDAYNDKKFKGIVTQIASSNNGAASQSALMNTSTDVTNYKVYVRLLPESYMDIIGKGVFPFRPGMSASADIQTKTHTNVISVPINAVTIRDKNDSSITNRKVDETQPQTVTTIEDPDVVVFIINAEGAVKKVKVKTAIQDINYIEITEGLKEGEMVITGPYDVVSKLLKEKDKVKVVDKKDLFKQK